MKTAKKENSEPTQSEYKEHFRVDQGIVEKLTRGEHHYNKIKYPLTEITAAYCRYKRVLNQIGNGASKKKASS